MIMFAISHGQADVEGGFSINTNVIDVNMKEQSIRSKRLVRDHMQKHNFGPATIEIPNVLQKSCRAAYQRYRTHVDEEKKKAAIDQSKQILDKEIKEVEGKIDHLMESSKVLDKKFIELVKDAENHINQSLIEEANALKRKSESQSSQYEKLRQTLEVLKAKRHES